MRFWWKGRGRWARFSAGMTSPTARCRTPTATGCLEFVDAWGQPLQFFRWPVLYHSDLQRGQVILPDPNTANNNNLLPPYQSYDSTTAGVNDWCGFSGTGPRSAGPEPATDGPAVVVADGSGRPGGGQQQLAVCRKLAAGLLAGGAAEACRHSSIFFHRLTEPVPLGSSPPGLYWDRSGSYLRRALLHQVPDPFGGPRQAARRVSLCGS